MVRSYKHKDLKILFAESGNSCAFPGCDFKIVENKKILIGEICHISAYDKDGPRYDENVNEKNAEDNLILLCPTHHTLVDIDISTYTIDVLKEMKEKNTKKHKSQPYEVSQELLNMINIAMISNEYSLKRLTNFLQIYKDLNDSKTKKRGYEFLKQLINNIIIPPDDNEINHILEFVFGEIKNFPEPEKNELLVSLFEKIPDGSCQIFIQSKIDHIKQIIEKNDRNGIRLFRFLNKSNTEILDFIIDYASARYNADDFNTFLVTNFSNKLNELAKNESLFLEYEYKIWKKFQEVEKTYNNTNHYRNIERLVNKFIETNL